MRQRRYMGSEGGGQRPLATDAKDATDATEEWLALRLLFAYNIR
jgi:hypothetical protein